MHQRGQCAATAAPIALAVTMVMAMCAVATPGVATAAQDSWTEPLTSQPGDAANGRQVVVGRVAQCTLCHELPGLRERMGNVGPSLLGVGARLSAAQIRLRLMDPTRVNPQAVMPAYHRTEGLQDVEMAQRGRPVLSAQGVEDAVSYLVRLR